MTMTSHVRNFTRQTWQRMTRKKIILPEDTGTTLDRCLNEFQLTFLGVGSMVGAGIYVLLGVATKDLAGPGVILSFLLAAFSILLTSMCFAEFGSQIPKSGSPYRYIFVVFGEFWAYIIGIGFLLGQHLSGAISARAWSGYFDSLINNAAKDAIIGTVGKWDYGDPIAEYPDFIAAAAQLTAMFLAAGGATCSSSVTTVFAGVNMFVLTTFTIIGVLYGDLENWSNPDRGGFLPHGFSGVLQGTSACFYAFFGFEIVTIAAEEATNYSKTVPRALISCILIATFLYVGTACSFTLLVPYWDVDISAPISSAIEQAGPAWMKYVILIGPMCGFSTLLLIAMYGLTRLVFTLSEDGFIMRGCTKVNSRTKVPLIPIFVSGTLISLLSIFFQLEHLFRFYVVISVGTYGLVCLALLKFRYKDISEMRRRSRTIRPHTLDAAETNNIEIHDTRQHQKISMLRFKILSFGLSSYVFLLGLLCVLTSILLQSSTNELLNGEPLAVVSLLTLFILLVLCTGAIGLHDQHDTTGFKVPFCPVFPAVCVFLDFFFMVAATDRPSLIGVSVAIAGLVVIYMLMSVYRYIYPSVEMEKEVRPLDGLVEEVRPLVLEDDSDEEF